MNGGAVGPPDDSAAGESCDPFKVDERRLDLGPYAVGLELPDPEQGSGLGVGRCWKPALGLGPPSGEERINHGTL